MRKFCFKCGLYKQGLTHDLSKFAPVEFFSSVKYFTGTCSPNDIEREHIGYSAAWLHHKGRNRHHWEYWRDIKKGVGYVPVEMPLRYVAEMLCDRIAACRVYHGKKYTQKDPYEYFDTHPNAKNSMHPKTAEKISEWLMLVRDKGEDEALREVKKELSLSRKSSR